MPLSGMVIMGSTAFSVKSHCANASWIQTILAETHFVRAPSVVSANWNQRLSCHAPCPCFVSWVQGV
jgi:hypothetical protein